MKKSMRLISIILGLMMALILAGCSSSSDSPDPSPVDAPAPVVADAPNDAPDENGTTFETEIQEFFELYDGVWNANNGNYIYMGYRDDTGEPGFDWRNTDINVTYAPGLITDIVSSEEYEYDLTVSFPENSAGDVPYDAFTTNVHISYRGVQDMWLVMKFGDEPELEYYYDFRSHHEQPDAAQLFWEEICLSSNEEPISQVEPNDYDNYVHFTNLYPPRTILFGSFTFNENSGLGEIVEMTMEDDALVITAEYPEMMSNGGETIPERTEMYKISPISYMGLEISYYNGDLIGEFYYGAG